MHADISARNIDDYILPLLPGGITHIMARRQRRQRHFFRVFAVLALLIDAIGTTDNATVWADYTAWTPMPEE